MTDPQKEELETWRANKNNNTEEPPSQVIAAATTAIIPTGPPPALEQQVIELNQQIAAMSNFIHEQINNA